MGKRWAAWNYITQSVSSPRGPKVIIMQEPTTGSLPNGIIFKQQTRNRHRSSIYVDCQYSDHTKCHLLSGFTNENQVAVSLQIDGQFGNKINAILCSIYFPGDVNKDKMITKQLTDLVNHCRLEGTELIVGCDANAHHTLWGCKQTDGRGEVLADFCLQNELLILNSGSEPTFMPSGSQGRIQNLIIEILFSKSPLRILRQKCIEIKGAQIGKSL